MHPMSALPWTLFCPRSGSIPAPVRPMLPVSRPRLTSARTESTPWVSSDRPRPWTKSAGPAPSTPAAASSAPAPTSARRRSAVASPASR